MDKRPIVKDFSERLTPLINAASVIHGTRKGARFRSRSTCHDIGSKRDADAKKARSVIHSSSLKKSERKEDMDVGKLEVPAREEPVTRR